MSDTLPLAPSGYRNDDLPRFEVRNRSEILYLLRGMQAHNALVSLTPRHARWNIITSILEVDAPDRLILDRAQDDTLNAQLLAGVKVTVSAPFDGVPILFQNTGAQVCEHDQRPALAIDLPGCVYRLQRREFFRIHLPGANPVLCRVPAQTELGLPAFTATAIDLGLGGIAFTDDSGTLELGLGNVLHGCRLHLPEIAPLEIALEVRNLSHIPLKNGLVRLRVGCRYVGLPNTYATVLQRFVMEIEQARRHL